MLWHLRDYQTSITLIKTGRLNKKNNTNIKPSLKLFIDNVLCHKDEKSVPRTRTSNIEPSVGLTEGAGVNNAQN